MISTKPLFLFYEEPDPDRWFKYDHLIRKIIRRIVRGKFRPGGQMMVALNLMAGLDILKIPYRLNDYNYTNKNPHELACIIGKPHIIYKKKIKKNPIIFGASVFSHPLECPNLFSIYPQIKKIIVPGDWMRNMFEPYYGEKVISWPVGIDTEKWKPVNNVKQFDVLIYDKVRWQHDAFSQTLIEPIKKILNENFLDYQYIQYGNYSPEELHSKVNNAKFVIFLCEHETQGIAYQQILSTNTPIFVWDRGGFWEDPFYYPDKVKFKPVSSVPYWDDRCGMKFKDYNDFKSNFDTFFSKVKNKDFSPRVYILENLTLEICAQKYLDIVNNLKPIQF